MNLKEYKPQFDSYLHQRLNAKLSEVQPLFPDEETFSLVEYLKPYVDHGKRFRPYMVSLWYSIYWGNDTEYVLKVGLIFELIHIFALIHDDICDQGTSRHGILSYHKHLTAKYQDPHHGYVQAILAGDLVYTRALEEAQTLLCDHPQSHKLMFTMLNEVVIGQMLDVHFSTTADSTRSRSEIANKDHLKSGQYTFQKPMMVWASLAGVENLSAIESLWQKIWIAFQMRDDLLDRIPNNEGKTKMSDIQEGNQTIVMSVCRDTYDEAARERLEHSRGKQLSESEIGSLKEDFIHFDVQEKVQVSINKLLDEVEKEFDMLVPDSEVKSDFLEVVRLLRKLG